MDSTALGTIKATQGHTGACEGRHSLRKSYTQSSELGLELLSHRHFGRTVHRVTRYVPPFLNAMKPFWEQWPASTAPQNNKPQCYLKRCWP